MILCPFPFFVGFIGQLSDSDFSAQCMGMQQDPNRGPEFGH